MVEHTFSEAHITPNGHLTGVSDHKEAHPIYKTDGYYASYCIPVPEHQRAAADALQNGEAGSIKLLERSFLGQLAQNMFDGVESNITSIRFDGHHIRGDTFLTHLDGDTSAPVLEALRTLGQNPHMPPPIGRAALLSESSRLKRAEVQDLLDQRKLRVLPKKAPMHGDGQLLLPLEEEHFVFQDSARTLATVRELLFSNNARDLLKLFREERPGLPTRMKPRKFLVAGVFLDTPLYHVMLQSIAWVRGVTSRIIHTEAAGLIAGRTVTDPREGFDRQFELFNANGRPEPTQHIRVVADVYRPAEIEQCGA